MSELPSYTNITHPVPGLTRATRVGGLRPPDVLAPIVVLSLPVSLPDAAPALDPALQFNFGFAHRGGPADLARGLFSGRGSRQGSV